MEPALRALTIREANAADALVTIQTILLHYKVSL